LFMAKEMLGPRLLTQHNLHFYQALMRGARTAIAEQRYTSWASAVEAKFVAEDEVDTAQ
jgi:queuine tRNA-ribosyltransferase